MVTIHGRMTAEPCRENPEEENVVGRSSVEAGDE